MKVRLNWLEEMAKGRTSTSFGVPWDRGCLFKEDELELRDSDGEAVDFHKSILAYWDDGSIKWTKQTISVETPSPYYDLVLHEGIKSGEKQEDGKAMAKEESDGIFVDTGVLRATIPYSGHQVLKDVYLGDELLCPAAELIVLEESQHGIDGGKALEQETLESKVTSVKLETNHAIETVVKITGRHITKKQNVPYRPVKESMPFELRLYFYKNSSRIRGVYTFFYDGNPHKEVIKGIGLTYRQNLQGELYNRHIRIAGDSGYLTESPKQLATIRTTGKYETMFLEQLDGKNVEFGEEDVAFVDLLKDSATWDDYRIVQDSATHYHIQKRTKKECCFIWAKNGMRSNGCAYLGGTNGGIFLGLRHFWEKYPSAIDFSHLTREESQVTLWFWSPYGEAMDLRHYDTDTHVRSSYEGFDELRSTPFGIANTSEFELILWEHTPGAEELKGAEKKIQTPDRLVCTPQYYSEAKAFGLWEAADKKNPLDAWILEKEEQVLSVFSEQVEEHQWYGFWNYGDIMRMYDSVRHCWKYDLGGCAWNNSELVPDMWLWYMFLHSGSHTAFRMAEAYTRHGSEVDQYHFGPYKGLGSRHNVLHWGCGCKEPRIAMAGLNRFLYYLTGDERMGDILDEVADADFSTLGIDPLRTIVEKDAHPTHARTAPDWSSYCANWMTKWERYQDTDYRDKIIKGVECLVKMPYRLLGGPMFGYDPKTGELMHISDANQSYHMCNCFGSIQVWMELSYMLDSTSFDQMLAEYGWFYFLSEEKKQDIHPELAVPSMWGMPLMAMQVGAYAAKCKNDRVLAKQIWTLAVEEMEKLNDKKTIASLKIPSTVEEVSNIDCCSGVIYMNTFLALPYLRQLLTEEDLLKEIREHDGKHDL